MITALYASLLRLMLIGLSINVIKSRPKFGAGLGDADNIEMRRRIRAQANLAEYTPMFLILLGYVEYQNLPHWVVYLLGLPFLAGRVMHAHSVLKAEQYENNKLIANPIWRIRRMICTFNCIGLLAIIVLIQVAIQHG